MLIHLLVSIILGVCAGIFTGLIPGVHINLISTLVVSSSDVLTGNFSTIPVCCFIISMGVTHTFLDTIPSIFLGAPEPDTALGVLPGHRMLLQGKGITAVKLTVIGSFLAMIISVMFFPLFCLIILKVYPFLKSSIVYLLISVVVFMIFKEKRYGLALAVFLVSGFLGIIVFDLHQIKNPLFPMLSGLFGISTLLLSLKNSNSLPDQKPDSGSCISWSSTFKSVLAGQFSGFVTAVMPGLGSSTAAVLGSQVARGISSKGFLVLIGSISTVNFVLSLSTFHILGKARNGAVIAIKELLPDITIPITGIFLCSALISGSVASIISMPLSRRFSSLVSIIDYKKLAVSIIILLIALTIMLSGMIGMLILIVSTAIGLIPQLTGISRTHSMGVIILPVLYYFIS